MNCPMCDTEMLQLQQVMYCPKSQCNCELVDGVVSQVSVHLVSSTGKRKTYHGDDLHSIFRAIYDEFGQMIFDWYTDQHMDQFWDNGIIEGVLGWWMSNSKRSIEVEVV